MIYSRGPSSKARILSEGLLELVKTSLPNPNATALKNVKAVELGNAEEDVQHNLDFTGLSEKTSTNGPRQTSRESERS
jgi:hypothetical protein